MQSAAPGGFLTTEEFAEYVRTTPANIHRWRYVGSAPPAYRVGNWLLFKREDIDAWLEQLREEDERVRGVNLRG